MSDHFDFAIKTDDTGPVLTVTCSYSDGTIQDLTGATVTFAMRNASGTVTINDAAASIVGVATNGQVQYSWAAGDTATAGYYTGEFHVTIGGIRYTFPNEDYIRILIYKDVP